jgi:hypothetical protein
MIGGSYVVAALVFVLAICGAGFTGWHERGKRADAEMASVVAQAAQKVAEAKQQNAEVSQKVVTVYKDRIVKIREVTPEVQHDVQVIRDSGCTLPAEFVRIYNDSAGYETPTPAGVDGPLGITCADAVEIARANNKEAREREAKLSALQSWAEGVSK